MAIPPALHFKASAGAEWKSLESRHALLGLFPEVSQPCRIDKVTLDRGTGSFFIPTASLTLETQRGNFTGLIDFAQKVGSCVTEDLDGELLADRVFAAVNRFQGGAWSDDELLMMVTLQ